MIGGFESRQRLGIFLFTTASRPTLGSTQPPIQCLQGSLSLGVKWPGREADHSPPSSVEVKECVELYLYSPSTPAWRGAQLKHMDRLYTCYLFICLFLYMSFKKFNSFCLFAEISCCICCCLVMQIIFFGILNTLTPCMYVILYLGAGRIAQSV
jgi:hypothetical protein